MSSSPTRSSSATVRATMALSFAFSVLASCSRGGEQADSGVTDTAVSGGTVATPSPSGATAEPTDRPLTPSDVDAFERGLQAELEAVNKAISDKAAAKTANDTLTAVMAATDMQTVEAGARAAGVPVDRYRVIVNGIGNALAAQQGQAMMANMPKPDTTGLSAEQKARIREGAEQAKTAFGDPYKDLPSDVAAALKPRAAGLDSMRMRLVGTRLKAAQ